MAVWETPDVIPGLTPVMREFGRIWQAANKIVYSRSLGKVSAAKTHLEREFDSDAVRGLKGRLPHDVSVGGPLLAEQAILAGRVDEYHLFVFPIVIGGGKRVLPGDVRVKLELVEERSFGSGVVYLRYRA